MKRHISQGFTIAPITPCPPITTAHTATVDNPVDNRAHNPVHCALRYPHYATEAKAAMDINGLIKGLSASFQHFSDGKKYKLINFAPKWRIVDKLRIALCLSHKQPTAAVGNNGPQVNNETGKEKGRKFSTYQRLIIQLISIFKKKERQIII